jgi:uncharacterized protein
MHRLINGNTKDRGLHFERFSDHSGFAINLDNPSGVKYLTPPMYSYAQALVHKYGPTLLLPPSQRNDIRACELATHGLAQFMDEEISPRIQQAKTFTVWLHIANSCNLSCPYCYIPKLNKAVDKEVVVSSLMTEKTATLILKELISYCEVSNLQRLQIKFVGGEPTLNHEVVKQLCMSGEALSSTTHIKLDYRIITNGIFDQKKWIPLFKKFKFGVSISVDGSPKHHNRNRFLIERIESSPDLPSTVNKVGSWDAVSKTIEVLLAEGIKPYLLCTLDKHNFHDIDEFVDYCLTKEIGFRFSLIRDRSTFSAKNIQEQILAKLESVYETIGNGYPTSMPVERFARFAEWNLNKKKDVVCGTGRSTIAINQDGTASSCQMRMNVPEGEVGESSILSILDTIKSSPDNLHLVDPTQKTGDCVLCRWRYICAGGCPEHTRQIFQTTNHSSPWCELYMSFFPIYARAIATQIKRAADRMF